MSEWREVALSEIADVIDSLHKTPRYVVSGYPMVRVTDVKKGYLDLSNTLQVDEETYKEFSKNHKPTKGDIVFSRVGSYGTTSIVKTNDEFCLGQNTAFIVPRENHYYLYYYLNSPLGKNEIEASVAGSTQPTVSLKSINNFIIRIPSLQEQKAIAAVLSSLDDKIDLLHRQNATLEAMAEALFRQWFVVEAKEEWGIGSLKDFASCVRDGVDPKEKQSSTVYVGLEHIEKKKITLSQYGDSQQVTSTKFKFKRHDILFGKLRPYFHKVCFAPFNGVCSTDILVIRAKNECLFSFCLFAFFQKDVVEYANIGSKGTKMPRTDWEILSLYPFPIPDSQTLTRFDSFCKPLIEKILSNQTKIRTLEKLRDILLPKLISGEVRVQG